MMSNQCVTASPHVRSSGKVNQGETPSAFETSEVSASCASNTRVHKRQCPYSDDIENSPKRACLEQKRKKYRHDAWALIRKAANAINDGIFDYEYIESIEHEFYAILQEYWPPASHFVLERWLHDIQTRKQLCPRPEQEEFEAQINSGQSFLQNIRYDVGGDYSTNDRRIPERIRRHLLPDTQLDFENINTLISVGNSMYCGKCTPFRHRKIYQYLEHSTIDMAIFKPTIYTHIDTCIVEDLRLTRKVLRRHAHYMPKTAARVKLELQLMKASDRKTAKQQSQARKYERQYKYDQHDFEAQINLNVNAPDLNKLTDAIENFKFKIGDAESTQLNSLVSSLSTITSLISNKGSSITSQLISYVVGFITFIAQLKNSRTTEECVLAFTAFFSRFVNIIDTCCSTFVAFTNQSSQWIREKINPTQYHDANEEFEAQSDDGGMFGMLNYFADVLYTIVGIPKDLFGLLRPHVSLILDLSNLLMVVFKFVIFFFLYIYLFFN